MGGKGGGGSWGFGDEENVRVPTAHPIFRDPIGFSDVKFDQVDQFLKTDISKIATGTTHVLLLSSQNELWTWGRNEFGQLGVQSDTY